MQFTSRLRAHWVAIVLALLASLIVALPQFQFRAAHHSDSQRIELLPDAPWSPRVREVMDGHPLLGSTYYKDGKDDPYLFQPFGSDVVGYMGEALGLDINDTLLASKLILTFIVFLLIYGFAYLLCREQLFAVAVAAVVTLADTVSNPSGLLHLLQGGTPGHYLALSYPVNPLMLYLPLFGFFITFWLFYTKHKWQYGVVSALLLGLQFYNYFYSWTYLYAFGGVLVLMYLLRKDWREAVRLGSVFAGAVVLAIPYAINLYHASLYPAYAEVSMRFGMVATHAPLFIGFVPFVALIVFLLWFPREPKNRFLFGLALLLAPIVTLNQQILTGREMQAAHYHWYFHKPIAVLFGVFTLGFLLARLQRESWKKWAAIFIIVASIAAGIFTQIATYRSGYSYGEQAVLKLQRFGPALTWLQENSTPEEVVLAADMPSHLVTIYTPLNVYYHRAGFHALVATRERMLEQLFTFYRLQGVGADTAREVFFAEREKVGTSVYGIYYQHAGDSDVEIPDEKIEEILNAYLQTLSIPTATWLKEQMVRYEIRYVIWDRAQDPNWNLGKYSFLKEETVSGDIAVYRFVP